LKIFKSISIELRKVSGFLIRSGDHVKAKDFVFRKSQFDTLLDKRWISYQIGGYLVLSSTMD